MGVKFGIVSASGGQSDGQFKNAMVVARAELKKAQDVYKDARAFIRTTIRPDLKVLRDQVKAKKKLTPGASTNTTTTTTTNNQGDSQVIPTTVEVK